MLKFVCIKLNLYNLYMHTANHEISHECIYRHDWHSSFVQVCWFGLRMEAEQWILLLLKPRCDIRRLQTNKWVQMLKVRRKKEYIFIAFRKVTTKKEIIKTKRKLKNHLPLNFSHYFVRILWARLILATASTVTLETCMMRVWKIF